jgi:hypothetical protein
VADSDSDIPARPDWHALLGPLPADARPRRQPVVSPEILAGPHGLAVAGWEQVVLDLSAGAAGLRIVLVVRDAEGRLLSASDAVLYRTLGLIHQESVGGRFEPDGTFRGTRWHSVAVAVEHEGEHEGEEDTDWQSTRSEPSPADVEALRLLVADVLRRPPDTSEQV